MFKIWNLKHEILNKSKIQISKVRNLSTQLLYLPSFLAGQTLKGNGAGEGDFKFFLIDYEFWLLSSDLQVPSNPRLIGGDESAQSKNNKI